MPTKSFIAAILIMASIGTRAQNVQVSTLNWNAEEVTEIGANKVSHVKCTFKTEGKTQVEWIQRNGNLRTVFTVVEVQGAWANVAEQGSITYVLNRNGNKCRMLMERTQDGLFVTMDFSKTGEFTSIQRFKISTID